MKRNTCADYLITGIVVMIGLAEAAHLCAVFLGWSFSQSAMLFWVLVGVALVAGLAAVLVGKRVWEKRQKPAKKGTGRPVEVVGIILFTVFAAIVVSQLIFICTGDNVYRQGDMTVETVGSFLTTDAVYQVNPMTGLPYTVGIPFRLEILCLPTLYGSVCELTGLSPAFVVQTIVPVVVLLGSYVAFASLGRCLFAQNGKRQGCFLVVVSLLIWAGTYLYGMDGFNLLNSGWRGVAIRNAVLVPWLISLCLRKKWMSAILCVLAEACIVWTLYGMGVCVFVLVGMAMAQLCYRRVSVQKGASGQGGKEEAR